MRCPSVFGVLEFRRPIVSCVLKKRRPSVSEPFFNTHLVVFVLNKVQHLV